MAKRGWKSRDTLNKARKELLDVELIIVSRYKDRKRPHLYALTFFAIDECSGKLDIKATAKPVSTWRRHEPLPPLKIKSIATRVTSIMKMSNMTRLPRTFLYCHTLVSFCHCLRWMVEYHHGAD